MMQFHALILLALCLITFGGCNDGAIKSVRVVNRTKSTIEKITVEFANGAWMEKFGTSDAGAEAEITPTKPLTRPQTASVRWVQEQVEHSADVEVRKELETTPGRGTLILNIEPDQKVKVGFEQD